MVFFLRLLSFIIERKVVDSHAASQACVKPAYYPVLLYYTAAAAHFLLGQLYVCGCLVLPDKLLFSRSLSQTSWVRELADNGSRLAFHLPTTTLRNNDDGT